MSRKKKPPWWGDLAFEKPSPWAQVRIAPAQAEEFLRGIIAVWQDPALDPEGNALWRELYKRQAQLQSELADERYWRSLTGWSLIPWVADFVGLKLGIATFLPIEFPGLPLAAQALLRQGLYGELLLAWGRVAAAENPDDPLTDPKVLRAIPPKERRRFPVLPETRALLPALRAACIWLGGSRAAREVEQRGEEQVGFHAARFLALSASLQTLGLTDPLLVQAEEQAREALRKAAWRKIPFWARKIVVADESTPEVSWFETLRHILDTQVAETVPSRWPLDPLEAYARSLEGELNIAPRAIADDVVDRARALSREEEIPVQIEEVDSDEDDVRWRTVGHSPLDQLLIQLDAQTLAARFLTAHPEYQQGVEALVSEERLAVLARRWGVTVQTVINRRSRALTALREWEKSTRHS